MNSVCRRLRRLTRRRRRQRSEGDALCRCSYTTRAHPHVERKAQAQQMVRCDGDGDRAALARQNDEAQSFRVDQTSAFRGTCILLPKQNEHRHHSAPAKPPVVPRCLWHRSSRK